MTTVVVVTGGWDPIHSGHIAYINAARRLGDKLAVGLNSDEWLIRKKGYRFLPMAERQTIIGNLKAVDYTFEFNDSDGSACDAIVKMAAHYPFHNIIFANGGDRTKENIPELKLSASYPGRLSFAFGVGGETKLNSSSWIVDNLTNYIKAGLLDERTKAETPIIQPSGTPATQVTAKFLTYPIGTGPETISNTPIVDEGEFDWKSRIHPT